MTEKERPTTSGIQPVEETAQGRQSVVGSTEKQRRLPTRDTRALAIQHVGLVVMVIAGLALAANMMIFFQTRTWHLLGITSLIAMGGGSFFVARNMARKGQLDRASYLMLGALLVLLPAFAFISTGLTPVLAVGTLVLTITLASLVLPRQQRVWAVPAGLLGAGLTFVIDQAVPWPRFEMAQFGLSRVATYGGISIPVLVILWQLISTYRQTNTIRVRLLIAFVAMVLLPVIILNLGTIVGGGQNERQQTLDRLESMAELKEAQINTWVHSLQNSLATVLTGEDEIAHVRLLLQGSPGSPDYQHAYQALQTNFRQQIEYSQLEGLFLIDPQGLVVLSTDISREGQSQGQQTYFQRGLEVAYVQPPFYSTLLGEMSVFVARPVVGVQGEVLGVLAGGASLEPLEEIMLPRAGLGETGEAYLVGDNHTLLTPLRFTEQGIYVHTQGTDTAIENQIRGSEVYNGYRGNPVMGTYRWLPELQVALLIEQDQAEAMRATYETVTIVGVMALGSLVLAVVAWLLIAGSIAKPLSNLAETAKQIADGNLELTAEAEREDEIGALAEAFNAMTSQLRGLISNLEQRVADRTRDVERRSLQLQVAAEVGRAVTSILETEQLIWQVTELILERFDLYHVGLFQLDETGEWAEYCAGAGAGARSLLEEGLRLKVGSPSVIGWCTARGRARIASDVSQVTVRYAYPLTPETRSEAALPLIARGRVIGALSVQSDQVGTFDQDAIVALQAIADQVAVAIENARLFAETQEVLEAARRAYGEVSRQAWAEMLQTRPGLGYLCDSRGTIRPTEGEWQPGVTQIGEGGPNGSTVVIPLKIRGHVVGGVRLRKADDAGEWTEEEVELMQTLTEQLSVTLESARLYLDTQRRAERERLTAQVTARMRETLDMETVLKTSVREIGEALGLAALEVRMGTKELPGGIDRTTDNEDDEEREGPID